VVAFAIAAAAATLAGCSTVRVTSAPNSYMKGENCSTGTCQVRSERGIPFLSQRVVEVDTLICQQTWLNVALTASVPKAGSEKGERETVLEESRSVLASRSTALDDLAALIAAKPTHGREELAGYVKQLHAIGALIGPERVQELPMFEIGRVRTQVVEINPERTFFLNAIQPLFGSATMSPELTNGLLSKATVTVQSDFKPIVDPLMKKFFTAPAAVAAAGTPGSPNALVLSPTTHVLRVDLKVEPVSLVYRVTPSERQPNPICTWDSVSKARFVRSTADAFGQAPAASQPKPQDKNTMTIKGKITLPPK
jgi:hypothetical protein